VRRSAASLGATLTPGDIAIECAGDTGRRQQIDSMLASEPWEEVAQFASYCVQGRMLGL
jgi:hypothetical protein